MGHPKKKPKVPQGIRLLFDTAEPRHILLAPSWWPHCILETLGESVVAQLLQNGYRLTVRPHPQTLKSSAKQIHRLEQMHGQNHLFNLEKNVASQDSLHESDLMICDWSGAALDYAFGLQKPVLFIDVPRKVNNPDYQSLGIEPFAASIREHIGATIAIEDLDQLSERIAILLESWSPKAIAVLREQHVFNVGTCSKAGPDVIKDMSMRLSNETR